MSKESFKEFKLPEALPVGYPFLAFAEHVIDRTPEFQSVSGARKGSILIDAVVRAEKSDDHIVRWPKELWEIVDKTLKSEGFVMPRNQIIRNGLPTDSIVPLRCYLPFADAILEAYDAKPKSLDQPSPPQAIAGEEARSATS